MQDVREYLVGVREWDLVRFAFSVASAGFSPKLTSPTNQQESHHMLRGGRLRYVSWCGRFRVAPSPFTFTLGSFSLARV